MLASGYRISHHLRGCDPHHSRLGLALGRGLDGARIVQLSSLMLKPLAAASGDGGRRSRDRLSSSCSSVPSQPRGGVPILSDCFRKMLASPSLKDRPWWQAWITLGRAQLNFGEPDSAIASFDKALSLKPSCDEAQDDRRTAIHLVKKRKQLHLSGMSTAKSRYVVGDKE